MIGAKVLSIAGGVLALGATGTAFADHGWGRQQQQPTYYNQGYYNNYTPNTYRDVPQYNRWQAPSRWDVRPHYPVVPTHRAHYGYRF